MTAYARYKTSHTEHGSNRQTLLALFERAFTDLTKAQQKLEAGEDASAQLHHVRAIYLELLGALDSKQAPDLTGKLGSLYHWAIGELVAAGRDKDVVKVRAVRKVTKTLYEGWRHAVNTAPRERAA